MDRNQDQSPEYIPNERWKGKDPDLEAKNTRALENARALIQRAKEDRDRLPQVELKQRAIDSLGIRAQGVHVARLVIRPMARDTSDAERESGLEKVIVIILESAKATLKYRGMPAHGRFMQDLQEGM
ncbi:hypothetical protein [Novipirellula sp.]|uniref:hypothetical protein n=1 Tax=Novipirellula sp. TaxID=2795430 RepID=UPI0035663ED5